MNDPRVGLVMIVKDEERTIERALRSAIPHISSWVIVDTGSTDTTKVIIERVMGEAGIAGRLYNLPWVHFGHNRSEALALCDGVMDWAIMLDADDNLVGPVLPAETWAATDVDGFVMRIVHGGLQHHRIQVFRTGLGWAYEGVVHETPICRGKRPATVRMIAGDLHMESRCEGVRSRNPRKYLDDAALLEQQVPRDARTVFYIAQSWRDAGQKERALMYYKQYMDMAGATDGERYQAALNVVILSSSAAEQLAYAWRGVEMNPRRLEIPFVLMQRYRTEGRVPTQELYAMAAACTWRTVTMDMALVNPTVYAWAYDDEFSVVAYATAHYKESYEASLRVAMHGPTETVRIHALENAKKTRGLIEHL